MSKMISATWICFVASLFVAANAVPTLHGAGFLAPDDTHRIVNGSQATPGQFPYQVGMYINFLSFCGGSIISDKWILTAAHCADGQSSFVVFMGAHNMWATEETGRIVAVTTTSKVHPKWDPKTAKNDVALLLLNNPVEFTEKIQPIRLPARSQLSELFVGHKATVSGWGKTANAEETINPILSFVEVTIITNQQCNDTYDSEPIFDTTLCCQGENIKSTCNGDSGGPLVIVDGAGIKIQVGVVSWGSNSGCGGFPHGYSRLTAYMPWISSTSGLIFV